MRGFTLIEMMIVFSLLIVIGSFTLLANFDAFRGGSFRSDRDVLVGLLQRARAQAMSNWCADVPCHGGHEQGVHIQSDAYILFSGTIFDPESSSIIRFEANPLVQRQSGDIVFEQRSGNATAAQIMLTDGLGHESVVSVSQNGRISWTH